MQISIICPRPGSPPPMRGKGFVNYIAAQTKRITPAYAGKRDSTFLTTEKIKDHPRLCGEKLLFMTTTRTAAGSPPPMRGKESDGGQRKTIGRITPAYAGKRGETATVNVGFEDHPRLCGEKVELLETLEFPVGSPPPMRGKVMPS